MGGPVDLILRDQLVVVTALHYSALWFNSEPIYRSTQLYREAVVQW